MQIDFSSVKHGDKGGVFLIDLAKQYTIDDLRAATNTSVDTLLDLIKDLNDADVIFDPEDAGADDPYAVEGEEKIGWSVAHLVAHVTSSSEEGAAFSSLLARGVPAKERPRYETPWRDITTRAQCVQRLEESRRIRLAYLETWPDVPHLDVNREVSENFIAYFGQLNASASFLFGLMHEVGHYDQFEEAIRQIQAAKKA
jgi:hypothetical protein